MNRIYAIALSLISLTGCFDENGYVIEPMPVEEVNIPYSIYEYQVYYKLSNSSIVSNNKFTDWDLGFESSPNGWHIILNASRFMYAGNTGLSDFESVKSNLADTMMFDASSGNLDSTAIGQWADFSDAQNPIFYRNVYIIDRGKDEEGNSFGLKKVIFEKMENNEYYLRFSNLDNTEEYSFQIAKNPTANFVLFSFDDGGKTTTQQPNRQSWDLCFTKYTSILFDDFGVPTPYLLRGVLINPNGVEVLKLDNKPFKDITASDIPGKAFSNKQDAIGYDWKKYENEVYTIETRFSYIIKDLNGSYYKLRFTDFYNNNPDDPDYGQKGYVSFEVEPLTNK